MYLRITEMLGFVSRTHKILDGGLLIDCKDHIMSWEEFYEYVGVYKDSTRKLEHNILTEEELFLANL